MATSIKTQAAQLAKAFYACTRGAPLSVRIHHKPEDGGFYVYVRAMGENVREKGAALCTIPDLSIDNIPFILNELHIHSGVSIYMTVYATVRPRKPTVYFMDTKHASNAVRVSKALVDAIHEFSSREDGMKISHSRRTSEISFCEYTEYFQYSTLGE